MFRLPLRSLSAVVVEWVILSLIRGGGGLNFMNLTNLITRHLMKEFEDFCLWRCFCFFEGRSGFPPSFPINEPHDLDFGVPSSNEWSKFRTWWANFFVSEEWNCPGLPLSHPAGSWRSWCWKLCGRGAQHGSLGGFAGALIFQLPLWNPNWVLCCLPLVFGLATDLGSDLFSLSHQSHATGYVTVSNLSRRTSHWHF